MAGGQERPPWGVGRPLSFRPRRSRVEESSQYRWCEDPSTLLGMTYSFGSANGIRGVGGGSKPPPYDSSIDGAQEKPPLKGSPQRHTAFVGRGEAKAQVEFSACGKWNIVACVSTREVAELQRSRKGFRILRKPLRPKSKISSSSPRRGADGVPAIGSHNKKQADFSACFYDSLSSNGGRRRSAPASSRCSCTARQWSSGSYGLR